MSFTEFTANHEVANQRADVSLRSILHSLSWAYVGLWLVVVLNTPYHAASWSMAMNPVWPLAWTSVMSPFVATAIIVIWAWLAPLGAAFAPESRRWRVLAAIGFLFFAAYQSSFGRIKHNEHAWLWASWFLIFLPGDLFARSRQPPPGLPPELAMASRARARLAAVAVWRGCQFLPLFFYFVAGVWKVREGLTAWWSNQPGLFDAMALPEIVADYNLIVRGSVGAHAAAADFLIQHPGLAQVFNLGSVALEIAAPLLLLAPRYFPRFLRWGAACFITFHLLAYWVLGLDFSDNAIYLLVFFVLAPLLPERNPS